MFCGPCVRVAGDGRGTGGGGERSARSTIWSGGGVRGRDGGIGGGGRGCEEGASWMGSEFP